MNNEQNEPKQEVAVWRPSEFSDGTDLLPMELATQQIDRTGRENVEAQDLILPSLSVLQGMSDVITKNLHPDARVGMFFHSGAQEVFKGPVRVLICAHTKSNALF